MPPIALKHLRSRYVGGQERHIAGLPVQHRPVADNGVARAVDMNGTYSVGQLYAMEYRLAEPRSPYPVLLWHGGGMTGAQWEHTPDGRPGWLWGFLRAGFDVIVCDAPERGRAGWAMFPQLYDSAPLFRSHEEAWALFRIGPAGGGTRRPFAGQQFPADHFATFARQFVPRWTGHRDMTLRAYDALLDEIGPCFVVGHSQGGGFACHAAQRHPTRIKAVVALEPTGVPDEVASAAVPHLAVWGDYLDQAPLWQQYRAQAEPYWRRLEALHGAVTVLDLPTAGLRGNSHFCMADRNGDEVLAHVAAWLRARG